MLAVGPFESWEDVIRLVAALAGAYWAILWLSAIVWTFRDVRDRSIDFVSQAVAVLLVLVFNIPGLILYLILRPHHTLAEAYEHNIETEAILHEMGEMRICPTCSTRVEGDFLFCPRCAARLREPCGSCSKPLLLAWQTCPYCGNARPVEPKRARLTVEAPIEEREIAPTLTVTPPPVQPPF